MKKSSTPKTKSSKSTKKSDSPSKKMLKPISFKIGRNVVYCNTTFTSVTLGPTGKLTHPLDFAMSIQSAAERRKFRKALHSVSPAAAALSVPMREDTKQRILNHVGHEVKRPLKPIRREDPFFKPMFETFTENDHSR